MTRGRRRMSVLAAVLVVAVTVATVLFLLRDGVGAARSPRMSSSSATPSGPAASPSRPVDDAPASPPGSTASLPATTAWRPGPGEPQPQVKRTASAFIETAGTWRGGAGAVATLRAAGFPPQVAATAGALEFPGAVASTVQVVYPQYGGLVPDRAAVITLFDQNLQMADGRVSTRQLALDVRLARQPSGTWAVERINPLTSLGSPVKLSATARAVLAEPRLQLSAPARLDVRTGRMNDRLLQVLLGLARQYTLTVQVMHTGHIQTVYPTDRKSNHAVGRAVDIRAVDGSPVVDPGTSRDLLTRVMVRAGELGATEVGAPFDLNGPRTGYFTDIVHQDHLHVGITPGKPAATR